MRNLTGCIVVLLACCWAPSTVFGQVNARISDVAKFKGPRVNRLQGIGLDVIPGFSVSNQREYNPSLSNTEFEPTLDAFYKFTPNLTGALTFNSDFSATDVDALRRTMGSFFRLVS